MRLLVCLCVAWAVAAAHTPHAPAAIPPQRFFPYQHLTTPTEAVTTMAGGPAVVLTEKIKSIALIDQSSGGRCGTAPPVFERQPEVPKPSQSSPPPRPRTETNRENLPLYLSAAGVAVSLLAVWLVFRR